MSTLPVLCHPAEVLGVWGMKLEKSFYRESSGTFLIHDHLQTTKFIMIAPFFPTNHSTGTIGPSSLSMQPICTAKLEMEDLVHHLTESFLSINASHMHCKIGNGGLSPSSSRGHDSNQGRNNDDALAVEASPCYI